MISAMMNMLCYVTTFAPTSMHPILVTKAHCDTCPVVWQCVEFDNNNSMVGTHLIVL